MWKWSLGSSGHFSSKSAYMSFFEGLPVCTLANAIWKSWAPLRCKISFGWLPVRGFGLHIDVRNMGFHIMTHVFSATTILKMLITFLLVVRSLISFGTESQTSSVFWRWLLQSAVPSLNGGPWKGRVSQRNTRRGSILLSCWSFGPFGKSVIRE